MRFFHPRPLHVVESVTLLIAVFLMLIASMITDPDGWFSKTFGLLQTMTVWWLLACQIASVRLGNYYRRKLSEQEMIITETRAVFPPLERPSSADEAHAMYARYEAALEAQREKMKAAVVRMHELIEEWKTYP